MMKKLINDPRAVVREMLEAAVDMHPALGLLEDEQVVVQLRQGNPQHDRVAIVSGGGSGHEPAHVGYVGAGMLSAAVVGDVFTSPSVDAVLAAIRQVQNGNGVLLIVKNYTGDRLNFGLAAELARAEGIAVEMVLVADDVALRDNVPPERRRGIAGTVLVHKLAGAAAMQGMSLAEVAAIARAAAADVRSMGVGLGACTVPAAGRPGYALADDEIELGLGIHGEKGVSRVKAAPADELVDIVLDCIFVDRPTAAGQTVAVLVNGLGGTPPMELSIVMRRALSNLRARGLSVVRAWMGNYMTALEMPGFSISVLPVDDARLALFDLPTDAPAWSRAYLPPTQRTVIGSMARGVQVAAPSEFSAYAMAARRVVRAVAEALLLAEDELTELDARAGDGDLGASLARGAQAILALPEQSYASPEVLLTAASEAIRRAIGGSSGPFYAVGLLRAAQALRGVDQPTERDWRSALAAAIAAISELGGAKQGDRTMLDALIPALDAWSSGDMAGAASAAEAGAQATSAMQPRQGRATYIGERAIGVPDAGAVAVFIWLKAIAGAVSAL
jgi:dihydroxyacetone kinase